MDKRQFKLINRIVAWAVFALSSVVYLATIEPTASFWDCGEFIASSYKLEVGHPPGNPTFNLFARIFTMFTDAEGAAAAVNAMSALCSSFTIFFLYLTIVHFGRRILEKSGRRLTAPAAVGILASGVIGAFAYCFSDTFWFSAVEGEVYAMSSLFTAVVFWAILKWEEEADEPTAGRWLILICFLMGLSVGVHLLNLLTIPAIVFVVYYKRHTGRVNFWKAFGILALSGVILGVILFGIIPYLPKLMAVVDRWFVNGFGAPFNVGATVFIVLLLAACFLLMRTFRAKDRKLAHAMTLCLTTFVIGYSSFAITMIRSCANTPTNEYQPDNPYTLIRYLGREQYGTTPILYGQAYTSPYDVRTIKYYTPLDGKYVEAENVVPEYPAGAKMLFPRMWDGFDQHHKAFYDTYATHKKLRRVKIQGETTVIQMPSFGDNLKFFFDYQISYMYVRYFLWNFVGRQNDFHGQQPGDLVAGNWESGIGFIDEARLGDQSIAPDILSHNKGKNHYFFLPLILGLIGLFFQVNRDGRNGWVTFLLFFLTGIAIVIYLNQPPFQVRERDYAYAGSFYVFALWIGLGVMAVQSWLENVLKKDSMGTAAAAAVLCCSVPVIMGCQNWDDHDRSGRYTARDMAYNHLVTTDKDAMLVTHGDNDTFPMWYAQEVESVRTDVRIVNTSLLGTDWYIDQMQRRQYESAPLSIDIPRKLYLYGTNDFPYVTSAIDRPILASDAIAVFKNPKYKLSDGKTDFIPAKKLLIPVNKENVRKYHIVAERDFDSIVDTVELEIKGDRIGKTDLIILDILANYNWDRPLYYVTPTADVNLGLENWSRYDGLCYKFVPIRTNNKEDRYMDEDKLYDLLMNEYRLESLKCPDVYYDYQNVYTFCAVVPLRDIFFSVADKMLLKGDVTKAVALLDKCFDVLPASNFPYNISWIRCSNEVDIIRMVEMYLVCGENEKAEAVARQFAKETTDAIMYFSQDVRGGSINDRALEDNFTLYSYLLERLEEGGLKPVADDLRASLIELLEASKDAA